MEILQAIVLGIIEGLTEFLPISSTGHLIVAEDAMGYFDASKLFTVVIQMGAIAAVMWFFRHELLHQVKGLFGGNKMIQRFWLVWVVATIPAGLAGLIFGTELETYAVTTTVALALIAGGVAIWLIETFHKAAPPKAQSQLERITLWQGLQIGLYQILALIPGVSRSGATIMGGLLAGQDRVTATAFSFYLSIPIILIAGAYKLVTGDISGVSGGAPAVIIGTVASFATALIVIKWLLRYVSQNDFKLFAFYRVGFGLILLALVASGMLG